MSVAEPNKNLSSHLGDKWCRMLSRKILLNVHSCVSRRCRVVATYQIVVIMWRSLLTMCTLCVHICVYSAVYIYACTLCTYMCVHCVHIYVCVQCNVHLFRWLSSPSGCFDLSRLHTSHLCRESIYTKFIFTKSEHRQFQHHTTSLLLRLRVFPCIGVCIAAQLCISRVHWGRYARVSRVLMRSDTLTSLPPSWEHLIKVSKLEQQQESYTHCKQTSRVKPN